MTGKRLSQRTPAIRLADTAWPEGCHARACGRDRQVFQDHTRPAPHTGRAPATLAEGAVS